MTDKKERPCACVKEGRKEGRFLIDCRIDYREGRTIGNSTLGEGWSGYSLSISPSLFSLDFLLAFFDRLFRQFLFLPFPPPSVLFPSFQYVHWLRGDSIRGTTAIQTKHAFARPLQPSYHQTSQELTIEILLIMHSPSLDFTA
mmetsp:Transcript_41003/g.80879  ORF Transcript_41003/g.80879 Transcript_41003/m.80879 type:complete len:143 (+) Transcript_41003:918-1346(+)